METYILRERRWHNTCARIFRPTSRKAPCKALRDIDILEKYGIALREPHVKHIDAKLWELRIKSASDISRIFYFVHVGENIVLLHGFVKKTRKTPDREIEIANKYLEDYQRRNET